MTAEFPKGVALPSLEKQWSIGIYTGADPLTLEAPRGLVNPVVTARHVTDAAHRLDTMKERSSVRHFAYAVPVSRLSRDLATQAWNWSHGRAVARSSSRIGP